MWKDKDKVEAMGKEISKMPIMLTKVEIEAQKAKRKMLKDIQDKCIHADIDQVMTKAGWRCMVCGKIIEDTPRPDSPKPGSI